MRAAAGAQQQHICEIAALRPISCHGARTVEHELDGARLLAKVA
jgi:hypothetical protein